MNCFIFFSTTVTVHPSFPESIYLRSLWLKYYEIFACNENTKVDPFSLQEVPPLSYCLQLTGKTFMQRTLYIITMFYTLKNNMFSANIHKYFSLSFFCGTAKEKCMLLKGCGDGISFKLLILAAGCGLHFLKTCYCHLEM
jgi:hypothetical protein